MKKLLYLIFFIGVFHGLRPSRNNINYNYIKELKGILEGSNDETPTDEQ